MVHVHPLYDNADFIFQVFKVTGKSEIFKKPIQYFKRLPPFYFSFNRLLILCVFQEYVRELIEKIAIFLVKTFFVHYILPYSSYHIWPQSQSFNFAGVESMFSIFTLEKLRFSIRSGISSCQLLTSPYI